MLTAAAFTLLDENGLEGVVTGQAPDLAGVHALVRAGAGVALLPLLSGPPVHTVILRELPQAPFAVLDLHSRAGLTVEIAEQVQDVIFNVLEDRN